MNTHPENRIFLDSMPQFKHNLITRRKFFGDYGDSLSLCQRRGKLYLVADLRNYSNELHIDYHSILQDFSWINLPKICSCSLYFLF